MEKFKFSINKKKNWSDKGFNYKVCKEVFEALKDCTDFGIHSSYSHDCIDCGKKIVYLVYNDSTKPYRETSAIEVPFKAFNSNRSLNRFVENYRALFVRDKNNEDEEEEGLCGLA